jgi:hypothetical protein
MIPFLIWYTIGFILLVLFQTQMQSKITIQGIIIGLLCGLVLGPLLLIPMFIFFVGDSKEVILWERKDLS